MRLVTSKLDNLQSILDIIQDAQNYLSELKIDQWQDGYPDQSIIKNDITNNESFCVHDTEGVIIGTAMFSTRTESTYKKIIGQWITPPNSKYGVIHRMAVRNNYRGKGIAKFIFKACEEELKKTSISSMRIDTHEDNIGMQKLLKKLGYHYCGIIYLNSGSKRLGFEKLIA